MAAAEGTALLLVDPDLRFLLPLRHRGGEAPVPLDGTSTIGHLVESLGVPRTEVGALLVGGSPMPLAHRPRPGDVVVVRPVERPQVLAESRFLLDVHLGTLARRMRLVGLDAAYRNDAADDELLAQAVSERRVLLSRDRGLLRRRALPVGAYVRGERPDEQLADVLDRFRPPLLPWSRCPACNGDLEPATLTEVAHLVQPGTRRTYTEFSRCTTCGQPYWRGAHAGRLAQMVERASRQLQPLVLPQPSQT